MATLAVYPVTRTMTKTLVIPSTYPGTCAGCHANDYKTGPHKKSENPDIKYTVSELRDCAGACHVYTNANFNVIKKTRNNEHNTNDGDFD